MNGWARANLEGNLAFWGVWRFDRTVVLAAGGFVTLAIAALGGAISARVTSVHFHAVLRDGEARAGRRREGRVARALVVLQVATVSVLMCAGSLSGIVAHRVVNVDVGYDTPGLLTAAARSRSGTGPAGRLWGSCCACPAAARWAEPMP